MTQTLQKIATALLLMLLAVTAYGLWYTNEPARTAAKPGVAVQTDAGLGVDETTFAVTQRLKTLADGPEEQRLAETAERLADHELDLAFSAALRRLEAHPPVLSAQAQSIQSRLQKSQQVLTTDQDRMTQLTAAVAQAGNDRKAALQDQLDLASSQVELDKDEVAAANQDLLAAGGNQHQRIQMMLQQHSAAERVRPVPAPKLSSGSGGLVRRYSEWRAQLRKEDWIEYAGVQAVALRNRLAADRLELAASLASSKAGVAGTDPAALLGATRRIGADQKLLTLLDQRIVDLKQLDSVYHEWLGLTHARTLASLRGILSGIAVICAIALLLLFIDRWLERLLVRTKFDRRQLETLRSITRVALQTVGVLAILLIVAGIPSQLGTMIGLAGAGLTVALRDIIVAFIGWLVLMGRNGVRVGDWVEINGVSGEVIELGVFHTVLLETGNWADAGHPTGRRVTFTNSYAIERHYFNFSTSGQWLWDELLVLVPYDKDPNLIAAAIQREVQTSTAASAAAAEQEWQRTAPGRRGSVFSAAPGISVRPAVGGFEVAVRYITRAADRFQLRSRLFQSAVRLLGGAPQPAAEEGPERLRQP